jgi:hypothetical protein
MLDNYCYSKKMHQMIRKANMSDRVDNADKLREVVFDLMEKQSPTTLL